MPEKDAYEVLRSATFTRKLRQWPRASVPVVEAERAIAVEPRAPRPEEDYPVKKVSDGVTQLNLAVAVYRL